MSVLPTIKVCSCRRWVSGHSLVMLHSKISVKDRRVIPLTNTSSPARCCSMFLRRCHLSGGKMSSLIKTKKPTSRFGGLTFHSAYSSKIGWLQKCWLIRCTGSQLDSVFNFRRHRSKSVTAVNGSPIRKWSGVKEVKSIGLEEIRVIGQELRHASN